VSAAPDDRPAAPGQRVLYGRRAARRLRAGRRAAVERTLPGLRIIMPPGEDPIDPVALFDDTPGGLWLEVGFGAGEHLLEQARAHPDAGFIGCEPFLDGVAKLVQVLDADGIGNVRIFMDDARLLLRRLPPRCLAGVFVLFSDPWPKTRHHKRRFVSSAVLDLLARAMAPRAELRIATDDRAYLIWILEHMCRTDTFEWLARRPEDWRKRPSDWPATRYERKAIAAGRECVYLSYRRRDPEIVR
jgi:tRNA (guanine-N7-)-methyltransferase